MEMCDTCAKEKGAPTPTASTVEHRGRALASGRNTQPSNNMHTKLTSAHAAPPCPSKTPNIANGVVSMLSIPSSSLFASSIVGTTAWWIAILRSARRWPPSLSQTNILMHTYQITTLATALSTSTGLGLSRRRYTFSRRIQYHKILHAECNPPRGSGVRHPVGGINQTRPIEQPARTDRAHTPLF